MLENFHAIENCHACDCAMDVAAFAPFSRVVCPDCQAEVRVKLEFGPYRLVRRHALGGMSEVFVAEDGVLHREVALKVLSAEYSGDERRIAAFEQEARLTASFNHPHVVRVLKTGRAYGHFFIAMELVPGGHFEHQIRARGSIPELEMLPLALEIAQGLKAAHEAGLIHRDVKPGNILLDAEGHAKLVDFGLALVTQGGKATASEVWATPFYVAPESIGGGAEDFRSDMYSFGATLYHALAGQPSCAEETMVTTILRESKRRVKPLQVLAPQVSAETCKLVNRAMGHDPEQRFPSYEAMIEAIEISLKQLRTGRQETKKLMSEKFDRNERVEHASSGNGLFYVVALLLLGGGVWWLTKKPQPAGDGKSATSPAWVAPLSTEAAGSQVALDFRAARSAVDGREFAKAAELLAKLGESRTVQEPTRSLAGVEAVLAFYLAEKEPAAVQQALRAATHLEASPMEAQTTARLTQALRQFRESNFVPAAEIDATRQDRTALLEWMLIGLRDWELGAAQEAVGYFKSVAAVKLAPEDAWLAIYQSVAQDYLADDSQLRSEAFQTLKTDVVGADSARVVLGKMLATLKTRGRAVAMVNARLLELPKSSESGTSEKAILPPLEKQELMTVEKLATYAQGYRFVEAAKELRKIKKDPPGAKLSSLLTVTESSAVFLSDLGMDLTRAPVAGKFTMKSGEAFKKLMRLGDGSLAASGDGDEEAKTVEWADISPDSLILLHRNFMATSMDEKERMRRNECALCFAWLAGNREYAQGVAIQLAKTNPAFRQRWQKIASGLPK